MGKAEIEKRKYFLIAIIALLVVFLITAGMLLLKLWEKRQGRFPESEILETTVTYNNTEYVLREGIESFLVLGLDKFEGDVISDSYNNDRQADFLMLFVFDNNARKYKVIHINRDTMANMNILGVNGNPIDTVKKQIALSHTYGNGRDISCRNAADAVSELLLGVKIDHYMSATMDAVPVFNDFVGGVSVEILDDFSSVDSSMLQGETITLKGEQALLYVRSRYGLDDPTNNRRMVRQKQYLEALYEKSNRLATQDDTFIPRAVLEIGEYIISDYSGNRLEEVLEKLSSYEFEGVLDITGKTVMGEKYVEFYPDADSVKEVVINTFYEVKK